MTTSYADLLGQIAELKGQAAKARDAELAAAKTEIKEIMESYGLTIADIARAGKPKKAHKAVEMKYRDPATGQTWTGRGRAPKWLEGRDKIAFLIK